MCLRTGSFISSTGVFCVHEVNKVGKWVQFSTCFCGLVDRILGWYAKGPRFKTHLGLIRNIYFYRNLVFFFKFLQNEILSNETATPQTNFGLYNIGSEMLWDRATAIWSIKFLSETPCMWICMWNHFMRAKESSVWNVTNLLLIRVL